MSRKLTPSLSVIMVTHDTYEICRESIRYLLQQTVKDQIELIISGPSCQVIAAPEKELSCFFNFQIVELGEVRSLGEGYAKGIEAASAPIVAYLEEHAFPPPNWAEILLQEHQKEYTAVGWALTNVNPGNLVSWAHLYGQFAGAVEPVPAQEKRHLAGHHTSYKKEALLQYGSHLINLLDNEVALQLDLHNRGHRLYMTDQIIVGHINITNFWVLCKHDFLSQKGFGAQRAKVGNWSTLRKGIYILGAPLIPWVRASRSIKEIIKANRFQQLMPGVFFIMLTFLHFGMVGELLGYLVGDSSNTTGKKKLPVELERRNYVSKSDLNELNFGK